MKEMEDLNHKEFLRIDQYANHHGISVDDVWRLIEDGGVIARCINQQILIFEKNSHLPSKQSHLEMNLVQIESHSESDSPSSQPFLNKMEKIFSFSQHALEEISRLNRDLIREKDLLLTSKNQELSYLNQQVNLQSNEIRKLKQDIEDLEILAKTLTSQHQSHRLTHDPSC